MYFYSTYDAPNGKIISLDIKDNSFVWNDVVNESSMPIRSANILNNKIVVTYLKDTLSDINIFNLNGEFEKNIDLGLLGTFSGFGGGIDDTETYFSFSNYITPTKIYKFNLTDYTYDLFWEEKLDGFDSSNYSTDLKFYESKDGTKIPVHVSHKTGIKINTTTPVLLYGYGGFDISTCQALVKDF